jgi:tetratricopeptide (TPR) repeat protein
MALTGNLRTMSLPDILQWIATGQKTGTLYLTRGSIQKRIAFREGHIFTSTSNDPRESLGRVLLRDRHVTEEQLFRALLRQEEEGRLLGSILVADGVLSEAELQRSLMTKAEESIYDLFLWPEGQFEFKEGDVPENVHIAIDLQVTAVVLEGIRRVDEWARIRNAFPTMATTFKLKGAPIDVADAAERQVLGLVAAGKSLAQIALEAYRGEFDTAVVLYELLARELIEVAEAATPPKDTDTVARIQELLAEGYQHLQARQYDAAIEDYEAALDLDRLNQHAKKGLIAVSEARARDRAVRAIPRDKVPHLTVDFVALTREKFDPQEGFVLSRVNGQWDVQSILKLCPMAEEEALLIFTRLLDRRVIEFREPL